MGWFNDNIAKYNTQVNTTRDAGNPFSAPTTTINRGLGAGLQYNPYQYSADDKQNILTYKTNIEGKDYFYSPLSTRLGGADANYGWDPNKAKALGGVEWTRSLYTPNPNAGNFYSNAVDPTTEQGYLFENDPNTIKNAGYNEWKDSSWWQDQGLGLAAIAAAPFAVSAGLGAAGSGGATPISGGGAMTSSASAPGGAMTGGVSGASTGMSQLSAPTIGVTGSSTGAGGITGGSLGSAGYVPAQQGLTMGAGGSGLGLSAPTGASSMMGAGSSSGLSSLSNLFGGGGLLGTGLSNAQAGLLGLSGVDMYMRNQQQDELKSLMERAVRESNPMAQPQRQQYQQMLSDYMNGNQDITTQPIVKSELDFLQRQAQAQMAKAGTTGSGNAGNIMTDYMLEGLNRTSQPYLNYLAGLGGFNQGVGSGGQIMATLGSQASGAPFQGMNSLGNALGSLMYDERPWWASANNAQAQMQGLGTRPSVQGVY